MKICSTCGWWEFAAEQGTRGQCTHQGHSGGDCHPGLHDARCPSWIHRCGECGEPAYSEMIVYSDDEPPISAFYCDECADGLGIGARGDD